MIGQRSDSKDQQGLQELIVISHIGARVKHSSNFSACGSVDFFLGATPKTGFPTLPFVSGHLTASHQPELTNMQGMPLATSFWSAFPASRPWSGSTWSSQAVRWIVQHMFPGSKSPLRFPVLTAAASLSQGLHRPLRTSLFRAVLGSGSASKVAKSTSGIMFQPASWFHMPNAILLRSNRETKPPQDSACFWVVALGDLRSMRAKLQKATATKVKCSNRQEPAHTIFGE